MPRSTVRRCLLDRNMPRPLAKLLTGLQVSTTDDHGWSTLSNGKLLAAAESEGIDIMLTADQRIRTQQNLSDRQLSLVVISNPAWPVVRENVPQIQAALDAATPGSYQEVDLPRPPLVRRLYQP